MAKHEAKDLEEDIPDASEEAKDDAGLESGGKPAKRHSKLWIIPALLLGIAAGLYFAGAAYFMQNALPNTTVNGHDISLSPYENTGTVLEDELMGWSTQVAGNGMDFLITADQAQMAGDFGDDVAAVQAATNPWRWPLELDEKHEFSFPVTGTANTAAVREAIQPELDKLSAKADELEGTGIIFDEQVKNFYIPEDVLSLRVDGDALAAKIADEAASLPTEIAIGEDVLMKEDALIAARDHANDIVSTPLTLTLGGRDAYTIDASTIVAWMRFESDLSITLDEEAIVEWARGPLSEKLDTKGATRNYTRPDGKQVEVSGGRYGWVIDGAASAPLISQAILAADGAPVELVTKSEAQRPPLEGGRDWDSWVDVDITEQHARLYSAEDELLWETDIVTGQPYAHNAEGVPENHSTPSGVYAVNAMYRNITLNGPILESTGAPEWSSFVNYWMAFIGGSVGLHDATWRGYFGGDIYTWYGSHGCVNLPLDKAEELFGLIKVGEVVVVHY